MDFLNYFDLKDRPVLKYCIITFIVINAIVLALLIFRPGILAFSGGSEDGRASGSALFSEENPEENGGFGYTGLFDDQQDEEDSDSAFTSSTAWTAEMAEEENRQESGPRLELTTRHARIHVGDPFNFYEYIKTMEDLDGSSLSRYIHLTGTVNNRVPGDYVITYRIMSQIDGSTASKDLLITVEP